MNQSRSDNTVLEESAIEDTTKDALIEDYFFGNELSRGEKKVYALVIYDIVDNKKRTRFAKYMNAFGTRVQKSCFETVLTLAKFKKMISQMEKYCAVEDSIRVYRVSGRSQVYQWGREGPSEEDDVIIL